MAEPSELVWSEATRLLARQEADLDTLRTRALAVLSAGALIIGVLGTQAYAVRWAIVVALALLAISAGVAMWILWPTEFEFSHDLGPVLERIEKGDPPLTALDVAYSFAYDLDRFRKRNKEKIDKLATRYIVMCALFGLEILISVASIAFRG